MESVPNIDELIPRVPTVPEKGAIIFLLCNLAIISPSLIASNFIGSISSSFFILKETVLLLNAVQKLSIVLLNFFFQKLIQL